jgi:hypothetical protein
MREQHAPGEREKEMDGGAEEIRRDPERLVHLFAEHQAGGVARDAGQGQGSLP